MDRQLKNGESISFDLPQFHCVATKTASPWLRDDWVEVIVNLKGGDRYMMRLGPNLTINQLKDLTAYKLLDLLKDWAIDLQKVVNELRSNA